LTSDLNLVKKNTKVLLGDLKAGIKKEPNKVWILNSSLVIASNASFAINSSDTRWLKIYSDGTQAHSIKIYGNMTVDSVKITSWVPAENDYFHNIKDDSSDRRAYISVMGDGLFENKTNQ
jgi:hypothetical protein